MPRAVRLCVPLAALVALAACGGPQVPPLRFNLDRQVALQSVLWLDDGSWFDGGAGFVLEDDRTANPLIVTPAAVWDRAIGLDALPARLDRVELDTFSAPSRVLAVGNRVVGGTGTSSLGEDQSENFFLFAVDQPIDPAVRIVALDPRDQASTGEVLFLMACRDQEPPCVQAATPMTVSRVWPTGLAARPVDPASLHAFAGAPLVTAEGRVVGVYGGRAGADSWELYFVPARSIRERIEQAQAR